MKHVQNIKNLNAYHDELAQWMDGNDQNGGLEFAFRNGFYLHAVSCWVSSGASALELPLKINRKEEMKEIKQMCKYADIFICHHCNHHSFYSPGEVESDETKCESCLKSMKIDSRGSI